MTPLLSTSPAARLTAGIVVTFPYASVVKPCAPRKPSAEAPIRYIPAGAVIVKVPSGLAITVLTMETSPSYKVMVTGLLAITRPVKTGAGIGVGVGALLTVRVAGPRDRIPVNSPSPLETRAVHSTEDCPACKPLALKVKTVPLLVARLPLLPATAKTKLPFCGPLIAVTGLLPNSVATIMLLASNTTGL